MKKFKQFERQIKKKIKQDEVEIKKRKMFGSVSNTKA